LGRVFQESFSNFCSRGAGASVRRFDRNNTAKIEGMLAIKKRWLSFREKVVSKKVAKRGAKKAPAWSIVRWSPKARPQYF